MRRHLWNTISSRSSHQRGKEGIFNAGTKLYARGGSGPGAGHLQVPRLQGDPQAQRRTPGQGVSDHRRAGQPKLFHGKVLLRRLVQE